jgi:HEAT repeat protein
MIAHRSVAALLLALAFAGRVNAQAAPTAPALDAPLSAAVPVAPAESAEAKLQRQRRETIRYGTDEEILGVATAVKTAGDRQFDADFLAVFVAAANEKLLTLLLGYFADGDLPGAEAKALELIDNRDDLKAETVEAAFRYLSVRKDGGLLAKSLSILEAEEERYLAAAVKAIGYVGGSDESGRLIAAYPKNEDREGVQQEIVVSLGLIADPGAVDFLSGLIGNPETKAYRKIAAIEAIGRIKADKSRDAVLRAVTDTDPNVRSQAVAALALFEGPAVDAALIEAFRDSYYKSRIAAAEIAGNRRLAASVPFLKFRAENDGVGAVREAAVRALGAVADEQSLAALDAIRQSPSYPDNLRVLAVDGLLRADGIRFGTAAVEAFAAAKKAKQTVMVAGLLKIFAAAKSPALEGTADTLLASTDIVERLTAFDIIAANRFVGFRERIEGFVSDKNAAIANKAKAALKAIDTAP